MLDKRFQEIEQKLHLLARQGNEVCKRIERSQARKPLSDRFESFDHELNTDTFSITLLGLSIEARDTAFAWLSGQDIHLQEILLNYEQGLVELTFREDEYTLEKVSGARTDFDSLDKFLEAVRKTVSTKTGNSENWISPMRLYIPAHPDLQGITLCIPVNVLTLNSPVLFNRLVSKTNLLILVAPDDYEPDENTLRAIEDLSVSMAAIWPIEINLKGNEPPPSNTLAPSPSWLKLNGFLRSRLILPPIWLPALTTSGIPGLQKINKKNVVRQALILSHQSERLRVMIELTRERVEEEQRNLKKQQKKAEKTIQIRRTENIAKELGEIQGRFRNYLSDEVNKLSHELADISRFSSGPKGEWGDVTRELIEKLDDGDLDKENITHTTRIKISPAFQESFESQLLKNARNQLGRDLMLIRDSREKWAAHIREEMSNYSQFDPVAEAKVIDEGELWEKMRQLLKCDISWHGEIPRTGPMEFFRAAYSPLIMGFMLLSIILPLFGGLNLKRGTALFAAIFIIAFVIMLFRAKKTLFKTQRETLDKELLRARENLRGIVDRVASSVNQEKTRRLGMYLTEFQKEAVRCLEQFNEKLVIKKQEQVQREILVAQSKLRQAEKSAKENMSLITDVQRLNQEGRQILEMSLRILQETELRTEWSNS